MSDCNSVTTPVDVNSKVMKKIPYQEAVGSLLFAAQVSGSDIQYVVKMLSRFNHNPGKSNWNAVKYIMRYLSGERDVKLVYQRNEKAELHGFCDAGYVFLLQGGAITCNSKRQPTVALSTTEAEYMAMSTATQEAICLRN